MAVSSRTSYILIAVAVLLVGFGAGFLGGFFAKKPDNTSDKMLDSLTREADPDVSGRLLDGIEADNIKEYLRHLTTRPHLAGTPADLAQAEELRDFWEQEAGLDRVALYPYKVLLSYPENDNPNKIEMQDGSGGVLFTTQLYEKILRPEQNQSDVVPPFNAYSASGQPRGDLVYVNYGRVDDFIHLTEDLGIDPTGHICIARYGKIFRGDKAEFADQHGCLGLVLYSDPADYAPDGAVDPYPDSWYLPGTGVQRGTVKQNQGSGDPLTPGYPSRDSAYRIREEDAGLPNIPVHPIGYDDASVLLGNMTGAEVEEAWRGDLPLTYRLGPGFSNSAWKTQMFISTHTENVTTYNAVGFIRGEIEPDRYVMLGNHRDAWVFGSLDPSSGTAALMEVSRAFGHLLKEGWRPRRSLLFCSWGAEEHGKVGSLEWVEEFGKLFEERTIAYINVDIAVQGTFTLRGKTMPLLHQLMFDAAKQIPNPDPSEVAAGRDSVYDTWARNMPERGGDGTPTGLPQILLLGSGSDFAPFVSKAGVTSIDMRYHYDESIGISSYPLYHSVYETFHLMETFYDPDFSYHKAVAQYWGELARRLADDYILPFDVTQYGTSMAEYVENLKENYGDLMEETGTDEGLVYLDEAVADFKVSISSFQSRLDNIDTNNPLEVRMVNDRLMQLDRMFLDPLGLPDRPLLRNVAYAPSSHNSYGGSVFPGLADSLYELDRASPEQRPERAERVKQQMSVITHWIQVAASSLLDNIDW